MVVGRRVRRADRAAAAAAIAGYTILNDVTLRDRQFRTREWLQGKTWEDTTPLGPCLVTPDELAPDAEISCTLDDEVVQKSTIGDLIATGTTGGVGHARKPPRCLRDGQRLVTRIEGIGELVTPVRRAEPDTAS